MVELQSCYFCGTVGELTEYALLPPRLAPTETEQRSVVLCPTCNRKVKAVLEPFVDRLDGDDGAARAARRTARRDRRARTTGGATAPTTGGDSVDDSARDKIEETAAGSGRSEPETPAETTSDDPPTARPQSSGVTFEATGARTGGEGDTPEGYGKVVRLLQNREFPMERSALEAVVTSAYDLDESACAAIVETAIERGVLVETDGELRRP